MPRNRKQLLHAVLTAAAKTNILTEFIASLTQNPGKFGDAALALCNDLRLGDGNTETRADAIELLEDLLTSPQAKWGDLLKTARKRGWEFDGDESTEDEDEDEESADETDSEVTTQLVDKAYDQLDKLQALLGDDDNDDDDDDDYPDEEAIDEAASSEDPEAALNEIIRSLARAIKKFSRARPVPSDRDDVEVLPPGTRRETQPNTGPGEQKAPPASTSHTKEDAGSSSSATDSPDRTLEDVATSIKRNSTGSKIDITLANDAEITLSRRGRRGDYTWSFVLDTYFDDDELEEFLDAIGGKLNQKKSRLTEGFGKKYLRFERDDDGDWDISVEGELEYEEAVRLTTYIARVRNENSVQFPEINVLEGIRFDKPKPVQVGPEEQEEYFDHDAWHEVLIELGMNKTSHIRYSRPGKGGKEIIIKIEPLKGNAPKNPVGFRTAKQAVLMHGTERKLTYTNPADIADGINALLPPEAKKVGAAGRKRVPDVVTQPGGKRGKTAVTVLDNLWLIEWDSTVYLCADGSEDAAPWLEQHGFKWHPALWTFPYSSKAAGLAAITRAKGQGITIENDDVLVKTVNGTRPKLVPFSTLVKDQLRERQRKPQDMTFSVHVCTDADGDPVLMATERPNNKKASAAFKKARWVREEPGYWMLVPNKAAAAKVAREIRSAGLRIADSEFLAERWLDVFGSKIPVDFAP